MSLPSTCLGLRGLHSFRRGRGHVVCVPGLGGFLGEVCHVSRVWRCRVFLRGFASLHVMMQMSIVLHVFSRKLASANWSPSCFSKVLGWMDSPTARDFSVNYPPSLPCPFTSSLVGGSNPAWVSIIASSHSGLHIWHRKLYSPHVNVPFGNWQGMWHVTIIINIIIIIIIMITILATDYMLPMLMVLTTCLDDGLWFVFSPSTLQTTVQCPTNQKGPTIIVLVGPFPGPSLSTKHHHCYNHHHHHHQHRHHHRHHHHHHQHHHPLIIWPFAGS